MNTEWMALDLGSVALLMSRSSDRETDLAEHFLKAKRRTV
jgi:hypothetical protein